MNSQNNNAVTGRWEKLVEWCQRHCTPYTYAIVVAVIIGVASGIAASALKWMIQLMSAIVFHDISLGSNLRLLFCPLLGILLTGIYQRYVVHLNLEHGMERIERELGSGKYNLGARYIFSPMIASTLTLGFGGSAGAEGPIATAGAAIGGRVGRIFKVDDATLKIMIGCGAGAGIAGIFLAPVGGAMFTLELLRLSMSTILVVSLIVACLVSAMTAYVCNGLNYDINFIQTVPFEVKIIVPALVLGVLCGVYSSYYTMIMKRLRGWFESIGNHWVRNLVSGTLLAAAVFFFPTLYGEGYDSLSKLINGEHIVLTHNSLFYELGHSPWLLMAITAGILFCKPIATCSTNSGGGVAGDFAPTLFAGAMTGFLFAMFLNTVFGLDLPTGNIVFIGMAGVMAGTVKAPLMAIFLTAEMADGYQFLLPLMIASATSYCIVTMISRLRAKGTVMPDEKAQA